MAISLKTLTGGTAVRPISYSGVITIPSGTTGVVFNITAPVDKRIIFTSVTTSTTSVETDMRLVVGGTEIASGSLSSRNLNFGDWGIGIGELGTLFPQTFEVTYGENFKIEKIGSLSTNLRVSYFISE